MLVLKPTQLIQLGDDSVPEALAGRIVEVSKRHTGSNAHGPYSMQRVVIADDQNKIQLVIKDRDEVPVSAKGTDLYATATRNQRGLGGMKRKTDNYKNQNTPQVWIYDSAELVINGAAPATPPPPAQNSNRLPPPPPAQNGHNRTQHTDTPAPDATNDSVAVSITKAIARTSAVYGRCIDAAYGIVKEADARHAAAGGFKPSADVIQSIAASVWISISREMPIPGNKSVPTSYKKLVEMAGGEKAAPPPPVNQGAPFQS